jgi:hypothetical protein
MKEALTMLDLSASRRKTAWFAKDQAKARQADLFIGRGSPASSTEAYRAAAGSRANIGIYRVTDVVFISAEGARRGRVPPDFAEIAKAVAAGVTFITDSPADRARSYNVGEREVAAFLTDHDYHEIAPGRWRPIVGDQP